MAETAGNSRKAELDAIRGGFVSQGTSFAAWCRENGLHRPNVTKAILGDWAGPKAEVVRLAALAASKLERAA
jgi:hypothetical protein